MAKTNGIGVIHHSPVYGSALGRQDICTVMKEVHQVFQSVHDMDLRLLQTDIAGFYNQVEHERTLLSIEFAVHRYIYEHGQKFDSVLQAHVYQKERTLRVFRGQWRSSCIGLCALGILFLFANFCLAIAFSLWVLQLFFRYAGPVWEASGLPFSEHPWL